MLKRKFNLVLLVFAIFIVFGLTSCDKDKIKEDEKVIEIASYFDLTDEKEYWNGSNDNPFHPDRVGIIFKKTTEYPDVYVNTKLGQYIGANLGQFLTPNHSLVSLIR